MELDVGYKKFSINRAVNIYSFSSLIDYSPNSPYLQDGIGEHYHIYKTEKNEYFIYFRVIGQRGFMSPGFIAEEGILPIPEDIALLIKERSVKSDDVQNEKGITKKFETIVSDLFNWLESINEQALMYLNNPEDLINDLKEMLICLNASSFRGCLALAGVSLERLLKEFLLLNKIPFEKDWMVGKLIAEIEKSGKYIDPSLKNIWNLINAQRIIGVHAKERTPPPSKDQALMVVFAVKDTASRMLEVGLKGTQHSANDNAA